MQNFIEGTNAKDASGNIILGDIGVHIQQEVSVFIFFKLSRVTVPVYTLSF